MSSPITTTTNDNDDNNKNNPDSNKDTTNVDEESSSQSSTNNNSSDDFSSSTISTSNDTNHHLDKRNDHLMAKQFRKTAIETIDEKRELFINYKQEQKGRMISFLTCIFTDPLTPLFNQLLATYLKPVNFSVFEGMQAEQVKKLIVSKEQIEMLQHSFQQQQESDDKFSKSIFHEHHTNSGGGN